MFTAGELGELSRTLRVTGHHCALDGAVGCKTLPYGRTHQAAQHRVMGRLFRARVPFEAAEEGFGDRVVPAVSFTDGQRAVVFPL